MAKPKSAIFIYSPEMSTFAGFMSLYGHEKYLWMMPSLTSERNPLTICFKMSMALA